MTTYFDPKVQADLLLLPPALRTNAELGNVAALAEAAVIGYYTSNPPYFLYTAYDAWAHAIASGAGQPGSWLLGYAERGSGTDVSATTTNAAQVRVYLTGYKADASDAAVDPNLKAALRMTVAQVVRWWLTGWGREPAVQSASDAQAKSRTYRDNADDAFPPGWDMLMAPFDARPLPWAL